MLLVMPHMHNLQIQQANCFYNYTFGLDVTDVDLVKTAAKFLKSGIARTVCFSDLKVVYLDEQGEIQLEWLQPQGRQWDRQWTVNFNKKLPEHTLHDLIFCLDLSFHERHIESAEAGQIPPHLRAALPPFILEHDDLSLPLYPWLKLYADGIMTLSFQLDTEWDGLDEADFIRQIVNLFQRYFERIWVQEKLQRMDAEQILVDAFEREYSIAGQSITTRKARQHIKEMRQRSKEALEESLGADGKQFELDGEAWRLHQIAGSEGHAKWEATIDLCRSIYASAIGSQIVASGRRLGKNGVAIQLWQGRPSISLMRFADQPQRKDEIFKRYGPSISRILMRTPGLDNPPPLPTDLRPFEDYCFHGNRGLLLWTWMLPDQAPVDAWEDANTRTLLQEHQARAEHFEYHNMRIARACAIASSPPSDEHLVHAYETLATAEGVINQSAQAGEITDALEYLMDVVGTMKIIASGKEQARWHLDERRFRNEKRKSRVDRWLAVIFGFVGAAGLAELVIKPFMRAMYPDQLDWVVGLTAFLIASLLVGLCFIPILVINMIRGK